MWARSLFILAPVFLFTCHEVSTYSSTDTEGKDSGQQDRSKIKSAVEHFKKGVKFFENENYEAAVVEFLKSYELSQRWELHYNIGVSFMEMGSSDRAVVHLKDYLRKGGRKISKRRRGEVEKMISQLEELVGYLTIDCSEENAKIIIDETDVYKAPVTEPIVLKTGFHKLRIVLDGFEKFEKEIAVAGGEKKLIKVKLEPVKVKESPVSEKKIAPVRKEPERKPKPEFEPSRMKKTKGLRYLIIGAGGGAALGILAGVTGILALKNRNDMRKAEDKCFSTMTRDDCPEAYKYQDRARAWMITTNVVAGLAGAVALAGGVLFLVKNKNIKKAKEKKEEKRERNMGLTTPALGINNSCIDVKMIVKF